MVSYNGKSVFKGIAVGHISVYKRKDIDVDSYTVSDRDAELERFYTAKEMTTSQLNDLYSLAMNEVGDEDAAIFMIHMMMLEDFSFLSSIEHLISDGYFNAEYAVSVTGKSFYDMFRNMEDPYMQARSADIKDITTRLLDNLSGIKQQDIFSEDPVIIFADELSPSETVRLSKGNVIAFATINGSASSHTAILARSMKMPAVVGAPLEITTDLNGKTAVIDGYDGMVYINPDSAFISFMLHKQSVEQNKYSMLLEYKGKENITADGRSVGICANVGSIREIDEAIYNGASGIGLFRSEFIYIGKDTFPTEDELYEVYRTAAEKMQGREVVIRTLDVGTDRRMNYYGLPEESNPALGCRGIRFLLNRPDIFKTQLRAIYRAAAHGRVSVLYPMVSTVVDMGRIRKINDEVIAELKSEKIPFGKVRQGILVETPSAVIISDLLARDADFLSIGTNDLAQYTMVVDRENVLMNEFFDPINISLFRMIKIVIENAHKYKKRVSVTGEMAADTSLTKILLAMGLDELSVTPSEILPLRKEVRMTDVGSIGHEILDELWGS